MPSSPPFSPATITNTSRSQATWNTGGGSPYTASLETPATAPPYDETDYLDFSAYFNSPNFPAAIPSGLQVRITWTVIRSAAGSAAAKDLEVYALIAGTPTGSNLERSGEGNWPGSDGSITYQADVDADAVNNNTLGLRIAAQIDGSGLAVPSITSANITSLLPLIPLEQGEVTASDDDGYGSDNGASPTFDDAADTMIVGIDAAAMPTPETKYASYIRFRDIQIPTGATITSATVTLADHGGGNVLCSAGVKDDLAPAVPTDASEVWDVVNNDLLASIDTGLLIPSSSPGTGPYPAFDLPTGAALVAAIQAYIDKPGYEAARDANTADLLLLVYCEGDYSSEFSQHEFGTQDGGDAAILQVEYTLPGAGATLTSGSAFLLLLEG